MKGGYRLTVDQENLNKELMIVLRFGSLGEKIEEIKKYKVVVKK